jgi:hypothetical protein
MHMSSTYHRFGTCCCLGSLEAGVILVVGRGIVRLALNDGLQVRDAEDLRCMTLSAAECEGGLIHDGSFVAIGIQFLYKPVRETLLRSPPVSSLLVSDHVSCHLIPINPSIPHRPHHL